MNHDDISEADTEPFGKLPTQEPHVTTAWLQAEISKSERRMLSRISAVSGALDGVSSFAIGQRRLHAELKRKLDGLTIEAGIFGKILLALLMIMVLQIGLLIALMVMMAR